MSYRETPTGSSIAPSTVYMNSRNFQNKKDLQKSSGNDSFLPNLPQITRANGVVKKSDNSLSEDDKFTKTVMFYKDGDNYFSGVKVPISKTRYRNMDSLLNDLNSNIDLPYGVRKLTTPHGRNAITSLEELKHNGVYVAASSKKNRGVDLDAVLKYRKLKEYRTTRKLEGISSGHNIWNAIGNDMYQGKAQRGKHGVISLPITGKQLFFVRNGRPSKIYRALLNPMRMLSFEILLEEVSQGLQVAIFRVFSYQGERLTTIESLLNLNEARVLAVPRNEKPMFRGSAEDASKFIDTIDYSINGKNFLPPITDRVTQRLYYNNNKKPAKDEASTSITNAANNVTSFTQLAGKKLLQRIQIATLPDIHKITSSNNIPRKATPHPAAPASRAALTSSHQENDINADSDSGRPHSLHTTISDNDGSLNGKLERRPSTDYPINEIVDVHDIEDIREDDEITVSTPTTYDEEGVSAHETTPTNDEGVESGEDENIVTPISDDNNKEIHGLSETDDEDEHMSDYIKHTHSSLGHSISTDKAATKIQANVRGFLTRKQLKERKMSAIEDNESEGTEDIKNEEEIANHEEDIVSHKEDIVGHESVYEMVSRESVEEAKLDEETENELNKKTDSEYNEEAENELNKEAENELNEEAENELNEEEVVGKKFPDAEIVDPVIGENDDDKGEKVRHDSAVMIQKAWRGYDSRKKNKRSIDDYNPELHQEESLEKLQLENDELDKEDIIEEEGSSLGSKLEDEVSLHLDDGVTEGSPVVELTKKGNYKVVIYIGNRWGAGTDSDLSIVIYGASKNSGLLILRNSISSQKPKFSQNDIEIFNILTDQYLEEEITKIVISHDSEGYGGGTFIDRIIIEDRNAIRPCEYLFLLNKWLDSGQVDGKLTRTLKPNQKIYNVRPNQKIKSDNSRLNRWEFVLHGGQVEEKLGTTSNIEIFGYGTGSDQYRRNFSEPKLQKTPSRALLQIDFGDIGPLSKFGIEVDGKGDHPDFFLSTIEARDLDDDKEYLFYCNKWLRHASTNYGDQPFREFSFYDSRNDPIHLNNFEGKIVVNKGTRGLIDNIVVAQIFGDAGETGKFNIDLNKPVKVNANKFDASFKVEALGVGQISGMRVWTKPINGSEQLIEGYQILQNIFDVHSDNHIHIMQEWAIDKVYIRESTHTPYRYVLQESRIFQEKKESEDGEPVYYKELFVKEMDGLATRITKKMLKEKNKPTSKWLMTLEVSEASVILPIITLISDKQSIEMIELDPTPVDNRITFTSEEVSYDTLTKIRVSIAKDKYLNRPVDLDDLTLKKILVIEKFRLTDSINHDEFICNINNVSFYNDSIYEYPVIWPDVPPLAISKFHISAKMDKIKGQFNVYIKISGHRGDTGYRWLKKPLAAYYTSELEQQFELEAASVGDVKEIEIKTDGSNTYSCKCNHISVYESYASYEHLFVFNKTFTNDKHPIQKSTDMTNIPYKENDATLPMPASSLVDYPTTTSSQNSESSSCSDDKMDEGKEMREEVVEYFKSTNMPLDNPTNLHQKPNLELATDSPIFGDSVNGNDFVYENTGIDTHLLNDEHVRDDVLHSDPALQSVDTLDRILDNFEDDTNDVVLPIIQPTSDEVLNMEVDKTSDKEHNDFYEDPNIIDLPVINDEIQNMEQDDNVSHKLHNGDQVISNIKSSNENHKDFYEDPNDGIQNMEVSEDDNISHKLHNNDEVIANVESSNHNEFYEDPNIVELPVMNDEIQNIEVLQDDNVSHKLHNDDEIITNVESTIHNHLYEDPNVAQVPVIYNENDGPLNMEVAEDDNISHRLHHEDEVLTNVEHNNEFEKDPNIVELPVMISRPATDEVLNMDALEGEKSSLELEDDNASHKLHNEDEVITILEQDMHKTVFNENNINSIVEDTELDGNNRIEDTEQNSTHHHVHNINGKIKDTEEEVVDSESITLDDKMEPIKVEKRLHQSEDSVNSDSNEVNSKLLSHTSDNMNNSDSNDVMKSNATHDSSDNNNLIERDHRINSDNENEIHSNHKTEDLTDNNEGHGASHLDEASHPKSINNNKHIQPDIIINTVD